MADSRSSAREWLRGPLPPGVDGAALGSAVHDLVSRPAVAGTTNALVLVAGGHVVAEWYGDSFTPESTHISWSVAKSITHALVGIAVGDGLLDPDRSGLMPHWQGDDRSRITLRQLLMMRSGLSWVEDYVDDSVSDVIEMLFGESAHTGDHAAYAASKPLAHDPGEFWEYSSGTTNIVARILADALGGPDGPRERVEKFMHGRLFGPIGMKATPKFDDAGTFVGSSFVYATARDFARFGELYLHDGVWNGERILPEGWVRGCGVAHAVAPDSGMGYGMHWWTWPTDEGSMIAHGYEGQLVWVSPRRDLVLVHLGRTPAEHMVALRAGLERIVGEFPA